MRFEQRLKSQSDDSQESIQLVKLRFGSVGIGESKIDCTHSQNEKALFLQCHIVILAVKLINSTGIGNDVMDGTGLMGTVNDDITNYKSSILGEHVGVMVYFCKGVLIYNEHYFPVNVIS